jgi:hypothetical protein
MLSWSFMGFANFDFRNAVVAVGLLAAPELEGVRVDTDRTLTRWLPVQVFSSGLKPRSANSPTCLPNRDDHSKCGRGL